MYRVVLTDDEQSILEGLKYLIEWEDLHLRIVHCAQNAEEALQWMEDHGADILITDIKMPGLGGIELIRRARAGSPSLRCLVLSGYDDFALVREAMRCGAENYLLKPVEQEEFQQNLKEIVLSLDAPPAGSDSPDEGQRLLLNNLMNRMVRNDISLKEFRRKMEFLQIDIYDRAFQIIVFSRFPWIAAETAQDLKLFRKICEMVGNADRGLVFQDSRGRPVLLAFIREAEDQREIEKRVGAFLEEHHSSWCAASGGMVSSYRELSLSYDQALDGIAVIRYRPESGFRAFQDLHKEISHLQQRFEGFLEAMALPSGSPDGQALVHKYFGELSSSEDGTLLCALAVSKAIARLEDERSGIEEADELMDLARLVRDRRCVQALEKLLVLERDWMREGGAMNYSRLVSSMIRRVEEDYRDYNLSLKSLASSLHVSPEHAGRVFKKESGRFFSDYLSEIRISRACKMLLNTSLPANEIALKTGFMNQNYFYTKFKKHTGMNPGSYRKERGGAAGPSR